MALGYILTPMAFLYGVAYKCTCLFTAVSGVKSCEKLKFVNAIRMLKIMKRYIFINSYIEGIQK
jgi:hypothetical protein